MNKEIINGIKELLRVVVLGIVSYVLTIGVVDAIVAHFSGSSISPEMRLIIAGIITSALKAVDKYLHELGVKNKDKDLKKGLTRF